LRAKFDSVDIVQSVWADVVKGLRRSKWSFENVDQLRAFLVRMTCNRFVDRARQHRSSLKHEVPMSPDAIEMMAVSDATPVGEKLAADELWNQILELCPPSRYEVLYLRRQGATLDDIATQTGLHKGSVRRILYEIGRLLARRCADDDLR
jgi:RNA polymerase sigma-70 factor (ECF subfamily)